MPGNALSDGWATLQQGVSDDFETFLKDEVCKIFENIGFPERLWLEPRISPTNGKPQSNGLNCSRHQKGKTAGPNTNIYPNPDFLIKNGFPWRDIQNRKTFKKRNRDAYLIGDFKASTVAAVKSVTEPENQWLAMARYASTYQAMPFVLYPTFLRKFKSEKVTDTKFASLTVDAQKEAFSKGVVLFLVTIYD